ARGCLSSRRIICRSSLTFEWGETLSGVGIRGSGFGGRDSGVGIRESGFGSRDSGFVGIVYTCKRLRRWLDVPFATPIFCMEDLKSELAALRIDQSSRGGGGSRTGVWTSVVVALLVVAGAAWYWTVRAQAAPVKVAIVTANATGEGAPGAVLNASGYVTAR